MPLSGPPGALLLLLGLGCARPPESRPLQPLDSRAQRAAGRVEVRQRPVEAAPSPEAAELLAAIPGARWDAGLAQAAQQLVALHVERGSRIDAPTASLVSARAGYPGQVRFLRGLSGGSLPAGMIEELAQAAAGRDEVDVGLGVRRYDDGTALWVLAFSPVLARIDPIPRDLPLDTPLPLRVEIVDPAWQGAELRLFLAQPGGGVEELSLTDGVTRWVDRFHTPGAWRVEVIASRENRAEVLLLFSLFVEEPPPEPRPLREASATPANPVEAEAWLFAALNELRRGSGLPPLERFELFEPLAREHSARMAAIGRAVHELPGSLVPLYLRARDYAFPFAFHHEAVATAPTADEAFALVLDSPAHRRTLLCEPCTHASVGVALEPVLDRVPRLFVTWELLEFPKGTPRRIDTLDR